MTGARLEDAGLPIATVARESGLTRDTLRVWERRYGFPRPFRDANGDRRYPAEQVATLRHLRRLLDTGHRAASVVSRPADEIATLASRLDDLRPASPEADDVIELLKINDAEALRARLSGMVMSSGLPGFCTRVAPHLLHAVGAAWTGGEISVHHEHLFTEQLTSILRGAIAVARSGGGASPVVLLTTLPGEQHGLGLLLAESLFAEYGCRCVNLGVQTPLNEIVGAAHAHRADILALSFSSFYNAADARDGVAALRRLLDPAVEIWAGGGCSKLREAPGVSVVRDLAKLSDAVTSWRRRRPA